MNYLIEKVPLISDRSSITITNRLPGLPFEFSDHKFSHLFKTFLEQTNYLHSRVIFEHLTNRMNKSAHKWVLVALIKKDNF